MHPRCYRIAALVSEIGDSNLFPTYFQTAGPGPGPPRALENRLLSPIFGSANRWDELDSTGTGEPTPGRAGRNC